ncbi:MAG: type VII secretion protein EccE, partial [Actinocatenispora sp.]
MLDRPCMLDRPGMLDGREGSIPPAGLEEVPMVVMQAPDGQAVTRAAESPGGSAATRPGRSTEVRPGRSPVRDGRLAVRVLVVQGMVAAVVATLRSPWWVTAVVGLGAAVVIVVAVGRVRQRSLLEHLALTWSYHRRRRLAVLPTAPGLAVFAQVAPDLEVRPVEHRGDIVGVAHDETGWYAGIALGQRNWMRGDGSVPVPVGTFARLLAETGCGAHLQIVTHTVPSPQATLVPSSPAVASYRAVAGVTGSPVALQSQWLVVRLDPMSAMEVAAIRGGGVEGTHRALCAITNRLVKAARAAGLAAQILDADGLVDALRNSCGLTGASVPDRVGVEDWQQWRTGETAHRCYWVRSVPSLERTTELLARLTTAGGDTTTVSLTIAGDERQATLRWLVRVSAAPAQLATVCAEVE